MTSSTFTDLKEHRAVLIKAIDGQGLKAVDMENDTAKPDLDVIDSSLPMVRDASAYIGLISYKYGQMPVDPRRNGDGLSLTELEFKEAQAIERPILLFIMGPNHAVKPADVETDPEKMRKLNAFRERAKRMKPDADVHRVYATFDNLEEFTGKAIHAVAELRRYLDGRLVRRATAQAAPAAAEPDGSDPIPAPPALYAEPPYIGSHQFVGRKAQLDVLSDWAVPADTHPVLLFDAIGGSGKSMLTWEWTTNHAANVRTDWAGRFWYSFYERGAVMADFCGRALAYITREPFDSFRRMKTPELAEHLLHQLRARPWLFVLDGLERVLVAYNRYDAAEIADEDANRPTGIRSHTASPAPLSGRKTTTCFGLLPGLRPPSCSLPAVLCLGCCSIQRFSRSKGFAARLSPDCALPMPRLCFDPAASVAIRKLSRNTCNAIAIAIHWLPVFSAA